MTNTARKRMRHNVNILDGINWTTSGSVSTSGSGIIFTGAGSVEGTPDVNLMADEFRISVKASGGYTDRYNPEAFVHIRFRYVGGNTFKGSYPIIGDLITISPDISEMGDIDRDFDQYPIEDFTVKIESKHPLNITSYSIYKSTKDIVVERDDGGLYQDENGNYVYDGGYSDGSGGGGLVMEYVRSVPVDHTLYHPSYMNIPQQTIDAYVDGYVMEFEHFRRPDFGDPPTHDHPEGEFIDPDHMPPPWAPKPDFGGFGPEGPKLIKYLYANDGRVYVNWNDGDIYYITSTFIDAYQAVHGYNMYGDRWVLVGDGSFSGVTNGRFKYTGSDRYVEVPHTIKNINVTSYKGMFEDSSVVMGVRSSNHNINDMHAMFRRTSTPLLDLSGMSTDGVTNMYGMFSGSGATDINMSGFNTSSVEDMSFMFYQSRAEELNLSNFNTSNVVNMSKMFEGTRAKNINVSSFDTSNVEDMTEMFKNIRTVTKMIDISSFDMSNVLSTAMMFSAFGGDTIVIGEPSTYNVVSMEYMFGGFSGDIVGIENLITSSVQNMLGMFMNAHVENIDLSNFDTRRVTSYSEMFRGFKTDVLDLTSFSLYKGANYSAIMIKMFYESEINTIDLSSFQTDDNMDMLDMFKGTTATTGYARTQADADRFNDASVTGIPSHLTFVVK